MSIAETTRVRKVVVSIQSDASVPEKDRVHTIVVAVGESEFKFSTYGTHQLKAANKLVERLQTVVDLVYAEVRREVASGAGAAS